MHFYGSLCGNEGTWEGTTLPVPLTQLPLVMKKALCEGVPSSLPPYNSLTWPLERRKRCVTCNHSLTCGPHTVSGAHGEQDRKALGSWVCSRQGQRPRELALRAGGKVQGT